MIAIMWKRKLVIGNKIASVSYAEKEMAQLITLETNIEKYHKKNARLYMTVREGGDW